MWSDVLTFVFFQAEDGIRDLVRSRGLGDVYKRQINEFPFWSFLFADLHPHMMGMPFTILFLALALNPVSYTHLTLPTSDLV